MDYPRTLREHEAADRVEAWSRQSRWRRFPQLGAVPEKWMRFGDAPQGLSFISEVLLAVYSPALRDILNRPSPLLQFLGK